MAGRSYTLPLPDGRHLGLAEAGEPQGAPVFYFHGFPGSRLEVALMHEAALQVSARVIALERPGYGLSSFQPGRSIGEWPHDVCAAAHQLEVRQFSVLGVSGGGPYALACAVALPERVTAAATVGGVGPLHLAHSTLGMGRRRHLACKLLRQMQWLTRPAYAYVARRMRRNLPAELEDVIARTCPRDQATLRRPEVRAAVLATFDEAVRGAAIGGARDLRLYLSPWDFDLTKNQVPTVLWHGVEDYIVPPSMARELAHAMPAADLRLMKGEGHYSLPIDFAAEILRALI